MTFRRLLLGLAALAVGVLVGLPLIRLVQPDAGPTAGGADAAREAAPRAVVETVQIGADGPPPAAATQVPDLVDISQQTTAVARAVEPTVVYVEVSTPAPGGAGRVATEAGSGVILSPSGYVLTNAHVVARAGDVVVYFPTDKREYEAEVVGSDPTTDVAVLRLLELDPDAPLSVASLGDSDALEVGEWVLAVGSPFRLTNTFTSGIVSALGRGGLYAIESEFAIEDFIQTDAAINQGNSGGALVNLRGEVVGVVTAIASESGYYEGYGFAVPMNLARRVAEDLIQYGEVRRGYLGVEVLPMYAADARERGMTEVAGVLVGGVVRGGPAERAGVRSGDVLLEIEGRHVDEPNQFQSRLAMARPEEAVALAVWRDGGRRELRAVLADPGDPGLETWFAGRTPAVALPSAPEAAPPEALQRTEAPNWGVQFRDLTRAERRQFESGAFVESVAPGSAAELDGLPRGTVVVEVEDRPVATAEEARAALARQARRDRPALLRVRRPDGQTAFYDLASPFVDE
ncbi:trypsin-like peptidase domain-containing protein [Rubrivirga litoralis]|uniref:Trypsin-like peptidase domain-containing protein n=1 Tax=Rubrivirga litoralis TaxID=3075598 RepID=A0ABU3BUZ3_9BACT|nr:trypsin-like peptidase domain-containing protein [Rubrivirga sp. F394]MDT0632976.1 trypsin-like peptidase domain-containing protein [Rubrivirga sp. F394]